MTARPDAGSTPWDPAQYLQFERERAEPFHDLVAGVDPLPGGRAVDLGCGTGALTCLLHEATILLDRLGFARPAVRLQIYLHHLPGPEALLAWVEGTLLNAYRVRMADDVFKSFLAQYREAVLARLPSERPYRFTFPRILIHARKPA